MAERQDIVPICTDRECINPRNRHRHGPAPTVESAEPECSEWCGTVRGRTVHESDCPYAQYFHSSQGGA